MKTASTKNSHQAPKSVEVINEEITALQDNIISLQESLARSLADYSNLEKRLERDRQIFVTLATVSIITRMTDVLDDLNLAQTHLQDQGLQMTINKFLNVLKAEGLQEIDAQGLEFDPVKMEAVEVAEGKENIVLTVRKKGYILNNQVIRPAQVVVGQETKN